MPDGNSTSYAVFLVFSQGQWMGLITCAVLRLLYSCDVEVIHNWEKARVRSIKIFKEPDT